MFTSAFVLSTVVSSLASPDAAVPAIYYEMHPVEIKLVQKTNAQRQAHGLRPLRVDRGLLGSARRHTAWMTRNHSMVHTSDPVAENIAWGQRDSSDAINCWMNSSGHRANMLNGSYTRIGVAAYVASDGSIYWCQQFLE